MYTYRDMIRIYSRQISEGMYDRDITDRATRRYLQISLNLASNAYQAAVVYPPTDATREDVLTAWRQTMNEDWRAFLTNAESARLNAANARVAEVLANI